MLNTKYNGEDCTVIAEYNQDGIDYVTLLFDDVEMNFIRKDLIEK